MIAHKDLMTSEFWQDKTRIKQYCYAILGYIDKNRTVSINVNFSGFRAYVEHQLNSSHYNITIPSINYSEDLTKQIIHRSIFLRHELAHICFTDDLDTQEISKITQYYYFNFIEDIRIEKLFSKHFNGSYTGFKTLRYVHYLEKAKSVIENSKSFGNFLAYMIYRNYGFSFNNSIKIISLYENSFLKVKDMFNVLTPESYYDIAKILKEEYAKIHKDIKNDKKTEEPKTEEEPKEEKISKQEIEDLNLDSTILEIFIPDKIEEEIDNEVENDVDSNIESESDKSLSEGESEETSNEEENETETITETSNEEIDEESKVDEEATETTEATEEIHDDDDDENQNENIFERKTDDLLPNEFLENIENTSDAIYSDFYQYIQNIKNNINFDSIANPTYFDLQEFCEVFMTKNRLMLKCDDKSTELSQQYSSILKRYRKEINDLGLFLKRKTVNKIIHKIKPFQLSGDIDEGNIADIFVSKNPRIFKNESYHYSPKNNIIILLDCSGSMFNGYSGNSISKALLVTIQMFEAALLANFDIEVYGFTEIHKTFLERKKKNIRSFVKKYGFDIVEFENRRGIKFNSIDIHGNVIFSILNTKKFKNQQDIFIAKNFLTNLYLSSQESGRKLNLFLELQGNTPEIAAMAYLSKYVKYLPTKNTIFMLNDGIYNDKDTLSEQLKYLYRENTNNAFNKMIFYPNFISHINKIFSEIDISLKENVRSVQYTFVLDFLKKVMPQSLIDFDSEKYRHYDEYLKENPDVVKLNIEEFCNSVSDFCFDLKNKLDKKETVVLNSEMISVFSDSHNFSLNRIDINKSKEIYFHKKKYSFNHEPDVIFYVMVFRNERNNKLMLIDFIIHGKTKRKLYDISTFQKNMFNYIMDEMCNVFYKHALSIAKEKNNCKIFTLGINSDCGHKYNEDFVYLDRAEKAGSVISEKLKQIW